jgi:hypothetical protein
LAKKNKRKSKRPTKKERIEKLLKSGPNIDAMMRSAENYILEHSGEFPGYSESIRLRRAAKN